MGAPAAPLMGWPAASRIPEIIIFFQIYLYRNGVSPHICAVDDYAPERIDLPFGISLIQFLHTIYPERMTFYRGMVEAIGLLIPVTNLQYT